jgi:hypothetical protein
MFKRFVRSGMIALLAALPLSAKADTQPQNVDYAVLVENHEFNHYDHFDGITCAVIVINALHPDMNDPTNLGDQKLITQENIFNPQVLSIVTPETVEKKGLAVEQLTQILQLYGLKAKAQYPHIMTKEALKETVLATLKNPNEMMIVHFDQSHISLKNQVAYAVVAGYDEKSDSILLLNVEANSKAKTWVKTDALLKSMQALDENHTPRGFILVEKPQE